MSSSAMSNRMGAWRRRNSSKVSSSWPPVEVRYRGMARREFDLDAALKRRPSTLIVDELAHSNIVDGEPRPRHAKRWQDIEELLDAGINVWSTLNIQHLESLNDVVAGITGVRQQETLPDRIFDEAEEVELIDLSPDDLLARLKAGKIYVADRAATATDRFFRRPNLMALRELALRRTADRVDAAARAYSGDERNSKPWLARDRFLIAIAPDDQAEQLVRVGKRFADALDAEWLVVTVETPALLKLGEQARNRRIEALRLAEIPWCADGHARRIVRGGSPHRIRKASQHHPDRRGRTQASRLAHAAGTLDGGQTGS